MTSFLSSLFTLWYKPGQTLQGLIDSGRGQKESFFFAVFFGLVQAWPSSLATEANGVGLLLIGALSGVAGLIFFSWLLRNFARWFGVEAKIAEVRTALGWGLLPWAALFGFFLILIGFGGADPQQMFPLVFGAIIYGFLILLLSLSVALRLSLMKAFSCLILTFLVSIFPITLLLQVLFGPVVPTP